MKKRNKPDRLTNPDDIGSSTHEAIYHAVKPLDRVTWEMEMKWGVGRLPGLVSVETAAKYGTAKAKLDTAIDANDVAEVQKRTEVMMRAWRALDAEASKAGHTPVKPQAWSWRGDDGQAYAICKENADAITYGKTAPPGVRIYSLEEVGRIIEYFERQAPVAGEAKETFPGALLNIKGGDLDDEIPF
jgi:hypothetical protein